MNNEFDSKQTIALTRMLSKLCKRIADNSRVDLILEDNELLKWWCDHKCEKEDIARMKTQIELFGMDSLTTSDLKKWQNHELESRDYE